jgi:hypothetical protein
MKFRVERSAAYTLSFSSIVLLSAVIGTGAQAPGQAPATRPPARDQATAPTGTAIIRGRVSDGETGRGLRRARIAIASPALGRQGRTANTDAQGRYEVKDLPAGRYTMTVRRSGYLELRYGQRRPFEQGKPLEVTDRQVVDRVDFALPKMSVISGRVTDELGEPIESTLVLVLRTMYFNGQRRLVPTGRIVQTDDGGNYRHSGLAPGTYLVQARANDKWIIESNGVQETLGYVPTYYPGSNRMADAQKVTVGVGKEIANIDVSLIPGRSARISGTAFDSQGRPFKRVSLGQEVRGDNFGMFGGGSGGESVVAPDGTFSISNVTPGDYKLTATTFDANGPGDKPEVAMTMLTVEGADIAGIALIGSSGGTITGRFATADGSPLPKDVRMTVSQQWMGQPDPMLLGTFRAGAGSGNADIKDDGTFTVLNVFGPAQFRVTTPEGWAVKQITRRGEDISDAVVEMRSDEEWSGVEVLLTDRLTSVTSLLTDAKGAPADGTLIVFAADAARWSDGSRFIRAARPDQAGLARIKGMPPGEYLAVGVDYVEDGSWNDRDYLASMRQHATKVTLSEGSSEALSLKVVLPER